MRTGFRYALSSKFIGVAVLGLLVAVLPVLVPAPRAQASADTDIYQYAGECVVLRDDWTGLYVSKTLAGYSVKQASNATPFRMQATALGRYLLYGPNGQMVAAGALGNIVSTAQPGPLADWQLNADGDSLKLANLSTGRNLSVTLTGQLTQAILANARWSFEPAAGCATFPEIEVNVTPLSTDVSAPGEVQGFLDAHVHVTAFDFIGGRFHCGRPWSPYGVTEALKDCPDHGINGAFAVAENLLSNGTLSGTHSHFGWPNFTGWPRYDSLTHEGTYWKGIERAWDGGLRIMVADLVENRALCELYWLKQNPCSDMASIRLQAQDLYALQDYIDAQYKGPGKGFFRIVKSPAEARAVIAQGKLAVVMGVETSQPFDCRWINGVDFCTENMIDQGLQELWDLGVRSMFPVHKFDNSFGGTAMDDETKGILVNLGNKYMTGRWWEVEACPTEEHDETPVSLGQGVPTAYQELATQPGSQVFAPALTAPLFQSAALPTYPTGPVCNVRGLTPLGEYLINRMIDMGMIIETDHMSAKTRDQALTIMESRGYSGVISSHSWGGPISRVRIQNLGGVIAPYANTTYEYVDEWLQASATQPSEYLWGIGFGTDTNGLGVQAEPRSDGLTNDPVTYPFESFDGSAMIEQSQWGNRLWDFNVDGASNYGLFLDWIEDLRHVAGDAIVDDLANGPEAYLQMWERTYNSAP